jgi:radical SAM protein (TIGR01212 family)
MVDKKRTYPWGDQLRYNSYSRRIRDRFEGRIQKVSVNAGFTCPNRDGTKGWGGCIYCNNDSFTPSYCVGEMDIHTQIDLGIDFLQKRYRKIRHFVAYFQPFTNTYAPLDALKNNYQTALNHPAIDGLVISTRPDCINDKILDYIMELNSKYLVFLEYGIESCYDRTLKRINRGHTFADSVAAIHQTADRGIPCTGHLLFGLPGENEENMLDQAEILSGLPLSALKFHQLQIIQGTPLAGLYRKNPDLFHLFTLDEYLSFVIQFIERLEPRIAIERLSSETPPKHRLNPGWGNMRSDTIQKKIESVLEFMDTWQGKKFKKLSTVLTKN